MKVQNRAFYLHVFVVLAISFLSSCVFDHPPTDKPVKEIDENLLGTWRLDKGNPTGSIEITKEDEFHYRIVSRADPYKGVDMVAPQLTFLVHHTLINEKDFLSLYLLEHETRLKPENPEMTRWIVGLHELKENGDLEVRLMDTEFIVPEGELRNCNLRTKEGERDFLSKAIDYPGFLLQPATFKRIH